VYSQNHVQIDCMGSEVEKLEESLTSMLGLLRVECGILERMVYKNKNQHRRCSYFQYLLKVHITYFPFKFKKLTLCLVCEITDEKTRKEKKFVNMIR
jgi:hypothetical protein